MAIRETVRSGLWTSSSTWSDGVVPQEGDQVIINSGHTVVYDVVKGDDPILGVVGNGLDVDIEGVLRFQVGGSNPLRLRFRGFIRVRNGGVLEVGTVSTPATVECILQKVIKGFHMILVDDGGTVVLVGSPNVPVVGSSYVFSTTLVSVVDTNRIVVGDDLMWEVGDLIAIPRITPLTDSPSNFVTRVTYIERDSLTLVLEDSIPSDLVGAEGQVVVKLGRRVKLINADTSPHYSTIMLNGGTIMNLRWVEFDRRGGVGNIQNCVVEDNLVYGCSTYCETAINTSFIRTNNTTSLNFVNCCGSVYDPPSGSTFEGGFLAGLVLTGGNFTVRDCLVGNGGVWGEGSGQVVFENATFYSFTRPKDVSSYYKNCVFYGIGYWGRNKGLKGGSREVYVGCSFYPFKNGHPARLDWDGFSPQDEHYVNCNYYDKWVEPSTFDFLPLQDTRKVFVNKGGIYLQIFKNGGIITTDDTDTPSEDFPYSYKFSPKSTNSPLFSDVPLPPSSSLTIEVWVKRESSDVTGKFEILTRPNTYDKDPQNVSVIHRQTFDNVNVGEWTSFTYTLSPSSGNEFLRLTAVGSSSNLKLTFRALTPTGGGYQLTLTDQINLTLAG